MPAARTRALRSGPNPATLDVFGTAGTPNNSTRALLGPLNGASIRWIPNDASGAGGAPPTGGTAASGQGWRDSAPESATDSVQYAAGTWTLRTRHRKTSQQVETDVTVRITGILYHVSSSGTHIAEVGRGVTANTVLSTGILTITSSFTTSSALTLAAGDKLQVELYVQNIDGTGNVAVPAAQYGVTILLDQPDANNAPAYVAQPTWEFVGQSIAVHNAVHAHSAESPTLVLDMGVQGAESTHTADNLTITQTHELVVADAVHSHTAESPAITVTSDLVVADAVHTHTAEELGITQQHVLAVQDAVSTHSADNVVMSQGALLVIADALHSHAADNVVLTGVQLTIQDAVHGGTGTARRFRPFYPGGHGATTNRTVLYG